MDTNPLKNKLTQYEAAPPPGAWDKLVDALEDGIHYQERLYNYQEQPAFATWSKIANSLHVPSAPAKIIPFTTRYKKAIQYLAAASIIGLIAVASTLLLKRTEAGALNAESNNLVPATKNTPAAVQKNIEPQNTTPLSAIRSPAATATITPISTASFNPRQISKPTLVKRLLNFIQPKLMATSLAGLEDNMPAQASNQALFTASSLDNYMVYSDGNGTTMKLPKKLYPLVHCNDGDLSCQQRIQALQQKLSAAALSADFTSVVEMVQELK